MSKDTNFPANWFTQEKIIAIINAPVSGVVGSAERIQLRDQLGSIDSAKPISISNAILKGWAHGAISGWNQETIMTRGGPVALTDGDRNLIRVSCRALKVWEFVKSKLPQVQDEEEFATDIEDEILIDSEAE